MKQKDNNNNVGPAFGITELAGDLGIARQALRDHVIAGKVKASRAGTPYIIYAAHMIEFLTPRVAKLRARLACYQYTLDKMEKALKKARQG